MGLLGVTKKDKDIRNQAIIDEVISAKGDDKGIKLKQLNAYGSNALILGVCNKSRFKYVYPILEAIKRLDMKDRAEILTHTNSSQTNALMHAARWSPEAVQAILEAMEPLDIKDKTDILKQISSAEKVNALMVAACHSHNATQAILKSMENLATKDKSTILKQCESGGADALTLALKNSPGAVVPLFKGHLEINDYGVLDRLLIHLETLSKERLDDMPELLQVVGQLPYLYQKKVYGSLRPVQYAQKHFQDLTDNRDARKAVREAVSHAEVRYHLAELKQKAEELDKKIGFNQRHQYLEPANKARLLHLTLKNSYEAFMRGDPIDNTSTKQKAPSEGARLMTVWADAIEKAKPVLAAHRGIKETLFRACTLLVTPLMWVGNAAQGNSFKFFPYSPETDTMHKVNKVMHALQEECHFDTLQNDYKAPASYCF